MDPITTTDVPANMPGFVSATIPNSATNPKTAVASKTAPRAQRGNSYHLGDGIEISRVARDVQVACSEHLVTVGLEKWATAVAASCHAGVSPELRTIMEFMLNARQDQIDWLVRRVIDVEQDITMPDEEEQKEQG